MNIYLSVEGKNVSKNNKNIGWNARLWPQEQSSNKSIEILMFSYGDSKNITYGDISYSESINPYIYIYYSILYIPHIYLIIYLEKQYFLYEAYWD